MDRDTWISIGLVASIVAAFGLYWLVGEYAADPFADNNFVSRFPEKSLDYSVKTLQELAAKPDLREFYVFPLLFPLDLFVMLALAASMGAAIWFWLGRSMSAWVRIALLVPLVYLLSDLIEDCFLAWLLQRQDAIPAMTWVLKALTAIKLVSVIAAAALTVAAFLLWLRRARQQASNS